MSCLVRCNRLSSQTTVLTRLKRSNWPVTRADLPIDSTSFDTVTAAAPMDLNGKEE
jgi:hypothetical protein